METEGGFVLVEDRYSWELSYNSSTQSVEWNSKDGNKVDISSMIMGGKVKGLLDAKKDLASYINKLEALARDLISNVRLPVQNGIANISGGFTGYDSPLGLNGIITLSGSTSITINVTASDSLSDIANYINSANVGFRANVVVNSDGTYSLEVIFQNSSYTVTETAGLGLGPTDSARVFVGYDIQSMSVNPSLEDVILNNLDYARADEFNDLSRTWWSIINNDYTSFANEVATTLHDTKNKNDIESKLLTSIESKLQEIQGVSIDKEFLEAMKLQRSYQALAKAITAVDEILQVTLNII